MNPAFAQLVESLEPKFLVLTQSTPFRFADLRAQVLPKQGVYVFTEGHVPLYVGRSGNIPQRLRDHCQAGSNHTKAAFAFRLAREACNLPKATYRQEGSRRDLMNQEHFRSSFDAQKARLRAMEIRVIEEADPNRQALLEMYVSVALGTKYNSFDNS